MAILPIQITGTPILHRRAAAIDAVTEATLRLIDDMVETMHAAPGVGLAAPQVGVGLQLFVWSYEDEHGLHEGHVINPQLRLGGGLRAAFERDPAEEGCLSIPGQRHPLRRASRAHLTGTDCHGNLVDVRAEGWLARIFQHEYDHLQGILYRDRLRRRPRRELDEAVAITGWGQGIAQWIPGLDGEEADFAEELNSDQEV